MSRQHEWNATGVFGSQMKVLKACCAAVKKREKEKTKTKKRRSPSFARPAPV